MPILIDGWNLIRNANSYIDDDEGESIDSVHALISYLNEFQSSHSDPIVVVFDSTREYLAIDYKNNSKLTIIPSRDADEYIKKYIDRIPERQRRSLRVVSSDSAVYYYAKSAYATPITCEDFWDKMGRTYVSRRNR